MKSPDIFPVDDDDHLAQLQAAKAAERKQSDASRTEERKRRESHAKRPNAAPRQPKTGRKEQLNARVTKEFIEELDAMQKDTGRTIGDIIERSVRLWWRQQTKPRE